MSLRNCLKIRNSPTVMSFKSCFLTSEPHDLYCCSITVNEIPPSSVGSNEILVIVYQKMPESPIDVQ